MEPARIITNSADPRSAASKRRRLAVIRNPGAGPHWSRATLEAVLAELGERGCQLTVREAAGSAENQAIAAAALTDGAFDAVVAAGGDGTVRAAARSLAGTSMPLGIIPVGTGNVLANEIGIGSSPGAIAGCLLDGNVVTLRTARANGQMFLLMAGAGFDGRVIADLDLGLKQRIGKRAYAGPALRAILRHPDRLRVLVDGIESEAAWVVATLRRRYGGTFVLSPHPQLDSLGIRAVLFGPSGRLAFAHRLLTVATGRFIRPSGIVDTAATTIEIDSDQPVPVQIDGEPAGTTPVRITTDGPPLRLIVPTTAASA